MKMANRTNSMDDPSFPGTRAKSAALMRAKLIEAQRYRDDLARAEHDPNAAPDRNLGPEALAPMVEGKRVVHFHTHRHDDMLTVLRLAEDFGFRGVLHHVSDASKVAEEIAAAAPPFSLILVDSPGGELEAENIAFRSAILPATFQHPGVTPSFSHPRPGGSYLDTYRLLLDKPPSPMVCYHPQP